MSWFALPAAVAFVASCARSATSNPEPTASKHPPLTPDAPDGASDPATIGSSNAPRDGAGEVGARALQEEADGGTTRGRLPPEVIQKVVRENYGIFRKCYEPGLVRNPKLEGKVIVRFVIDLDGKVSHPTVVPESTLPDKLVAECVLDSYRKLVFPKPEGGIVTVVYPIMFSPG